MKPVIILRGLIPFVWALLALGGQQFTPKPGDDIIPGQYIVKFRSDAAPAAVLNSIDPSLKIVRSAALGGRLVSVPTANVDSLLGKIAAHPSVEWVEPNHRRKAQVTNPSDTSFASQYALSIIDAVSAWSSVPGAYLTAASAGTGRIRVAVIDTGIDCTHPDFKNAGGTSVDSASGGQIAMAASKALVHTSLSSPACAFQDDHGHGTHTAGIIAAAANNARGIAGLAYPAELMILKALDGMGFGDDVTISNAIVEAVNGGARIISMSLGGTGYSQNLQEALRYAFQRGVFVICAAGNYASSNLFYPGDSNFTVAVAATDSANARAWFSNYGNWIGIAAPGVNIYSTVTTYNLGDGITNYGSMSGTSMSTPYVAALAALVQMASPGLGVTGTLQQIQRSATSGQAGGGWGPSLGYGVISASKALNSTYRSAAYGSIRGQVTNASGMPLAGAVVKAGPLAFTTSSDGLFRLANLLPGPVTVTTTASGYGADVRSATVVAGADSTLAINMSENSGTYTGLVTSLGVPVEGAVVEVLTEGLVVATATTSLSGEYSVTVPAGAHSLRASAFGYGTSVRAAPSVSTGGTATINLVLTSPGTIGGTVTDSSGAGVPNMQVLAQMNGFQRGAVTNAAGEYSIPGLPAGTYQVSAGSASTTGIGVAPGASVPVNLSLGASTLTLTPAVVVVPGGQSAQFTASGAGLPVAWTVSPALGTISSTGVYTAPSITSPATVNIKATSLADPNLSAASAVLVNGKITLSCGSTTVTGGNNLSNCQVTLSSPAPAGGITVTLTSSNPAVVNPLASISISGNKAMSIPAGSISSSPFQVATSVVASTTTVNLTASALGMTSVVTITVKPATVMAVSLGQTSVTGGSNAISNVVWLDGPAPAGGVTITLSSSDPAAQPPSTVQVAEGSSSSNTFIIKTTQVATTTVATISAALNGVTKSENLTITASSSSVGLKKLTLSPSSMRGGSTSTSNWLWLANPAPSTGATVQLTSSNPAVAGVPASVVVAPGATSASFSITTSPVAANLDVVITASAGGTSLNETLSLRAPSLTSFYVRSSSVGGGAVVPSNRVTLDGPAPAGGLAIALSSSSPLVQAPSTVMVAEGQTVSTYFDIPTSATSTPVDVTITASSNGVERSVILTVRPPAVSSISMSPYSVVGPNTTTANRLSIDGPAPAGGAAVALSSSDPWVSVPAIVIIPAGQTSTTFTASVDAVAVTSTATVTASLGGVSKTSSLTVRTPVLLSMYVPSTSAIGGTIVANNRVNLDGRAPAAGVTVYLTSSDPDLVPVPASVVVPAGEMSSPYFSISTAPPSTATMVTITATYLGVSKTDTFELRPPTP